MDDLVRWLGEQLDEDERIARRVESSWRQIGETGVIVASDGDRAEECANGNWSGIAEHIVRHDPTRVLREIDAKRQLLAAYAEVASNDTADAYEYADGWANALGLAVRHVAAGYSDRTGYKAEEWAP